MAGKADIVESVFNQVEDLTKKQAGETFDAIFDAITEYLENKDRVQIPGFGSFMVRHRKARKGRNPATGESIQIPASYNVGFKAGTALKEAVND